MTLRQIARRLVAPAARWFPPTVVEGLLYHGIARFTSLLPPAERIRFLMRLDSRLYGLQGAAAIAYGDRIHTKHRHMRYHEFFIGRIRQGERVLDIGCGNGAVAYDVAEKGGAYVVGLDLSEENIALARERYAHARVEYHVGDALKEPPQGRFDVVILSNILEHLPGRVEFLRRLQQVIRSSRVLIRVPLFERDWRVPLKRELGVEWRCDPTHETEYTLESFAEEIAAAGLKITCQEVRWGEIWAEVLCVGEQGPTTTL